VKYQVIKTLRGVCYGVLLLCVVTPSIAAEFSHRAWDNLLQKNVVMIQDGQASRVDYAAMKDDRNILQAYLASLSAVDVMVFDSWSKDQQLALLINAYNAWTIDLILTRYPDLESIKDLGSFFSSPWKKEFISFLGETRSLDNIEHKLIRGSGRYNEPRIHFAVNCASIGCPALLNSAYTAEKLEVQLDLVTQNFLSDRSRNYFSNGELHISSIFKWYKTDFEQGWGGADSLSSFLVAYLDVLGLSGPGSGIVVNGKSAVARLGDGSLGISYTDYDWDLNDVGK
jgi:hypothetical protein